jgi:tRNA/tmRNA/rRNA uracil-C5-methylase (TrmA/RlmC/RlmD family)
VTTPSLTTTAMAVGGEAIAREGSGRVVFVSGALPGETVAVEVLEEKKTFARAAVVEVLEAAPERVVPPCPNVELGCGGCDWQHIEVGHQRELRRGIVADVLARQGKVPDPQVRAGAPLAAEGLRTTVRGVADAEGRFAFRRRRSHDLIAVDRCLVAHEAVNEVIAQGTFPPGAEVVVRVGARTGERSVVVGPSGEGTRVPEGVTVVGERELADGHRAWIHEEAAGRTWRVSARSFFQASPEGAEALVDAVDGFIAEHAPGAERLVDLCCGVGLFAGTVGAGRTVVGVERSASSVADARQNLPDVDARIVKVALARWRPSPADVVVADPARSGLGKEGVAAVTGTGASLCVLVSCDPAALGRDAALLAEAGYEHVGSVVVDLFGHTSHIEVVSGFTKRVEVGTEPG